MQENPSPVAQVLAEMEALQSERATHVARIVEIDRKAAKIAELLGVSLASSPASTPSIPRLQREDRRSAGTMSQAMLEILLKAEKGYTRLELKEEIRKTPKFAEQLDRNVNAYYNNVLRYIRGGKIVEVDGLMYHPDRAPLPEGEEDPSGRHLPPNVSPLFAERKTDAG
ncbi:MAG: hypothetical protein QOG84_1018 [Sphingomonadales bacterium]|jgi:hypothetical protein|nr:hypothetical protein [Sphingomonadales bacterium]